MILFFPLSVCIGLRFKNHTTLGRELRGNERSLDSPREHGQMPIPGLSPEDSVSAAPGLSKFGEQCLEQSQKHD